MENSKSARLFVANLNSKITREDLQEKFGEFGKVTDIRIKDSRDVFAFVEFEDQDSAQTALDKLNKSEYMGKEMRVEFAKGRRDGGGGGGRGGRFGDRGGDRRRRSRSRSNERRGGGGGYRGGDRGERRFSKGGDRGDRRYNDRGGDRGGERRERKYSNDS